MSIDLSKIKNVVSQFFGEVQRGKWVAAALYTQPSWQAIKSPQSTEDRVEALFGDRRITGHEIGEAMRVSDVMYDVIVDLTFAGTTAERRFIIRAICEKGPYKASTEGEWSVNPTSMRAQR